MQFSEWLQAALQRSGKSKAEFIENSRISKPMVYKMLCGDRLPTPSMAAKIAETLRVPVEEILPFTRPNFGRPKK